MVSSEQKMTGWQPAKLPELATLAGRFVTLEPLSAARHGHALWQAVDGHDAVWDWLADGPYSSEQELTSALELKQHGTAARFFALIPAETGGDAAGYASYMRIDAPNGVIEVGNVMFSPALQRTPAATEAMFLMARHVFEDLGYRRYEWKCNAGNLPSRRAAARLGFTYEGIFRQHMIVKGMNRDTAWFSMLDSEWPERRAAFEAWLAPQNFDADGRQVQPLRAGGKLATDAG